MHFKGSCSQFGALRTNVFTIVTQLLVAQFVLLIFSEEMALLALAVPSRPLRALGMHVLSV